MNKFKLNAAFRDLRAAGAIARQEFLCCSTCATAALADALDEKPDKIGVVFYHQQDADAMREGMPLRIRYGSRDSSRDSSRMLGHLVANVLRSHGFEPQWDGDPDKAIRIRVEGEFDYDDA